MHIYMYMQICMCMFVHHNWCWCTYLCMSLFLCMYVYAFDRCPSECKSKGNNTETNKDVCRQIKIQKHLNILSHVLRCAHTKARILTSTIACASFEFFAHTLTVVSIPMHVALKLSFGGYVNNALTQFPPAGRSGGPAVSSCSKNELWGLVKGITWMKKAARGYASRHLMTRWRRTDAPACQEGSHCPAAAHE